MRRPVQAVHRKRNQDDLAGLLVQQGAEVERLPLAEHTA